MNGLKADYDNGVRKQTDLSEIPVSRRQVLQGSLALAGIPVCCLTELVPRDCVTYDGELLRLKLSEGSGLRQPGSARAVVDAERKLNIIVIHESPGNFVALNRSCTHGGAQCAYNRRRRTVQCTSLNHAEYDLAGVLLHGRTHGNLRTYEVRAEGGWLEIRTENKA